MNPKTRKQILVLIGLVAVAAVFCLVPQPPASTVSAQSTFTPKVVFLVRHAEKADAPRQDPPLNDAGVVRAKELARMLESAGIKTIITSQFLRAKQTAEPLAQKLGLTAATMPIAMNPSNPQQVSEQSISEIVARVNERPGENVLVIGHSNTVPEVIRMLGGDVVPTIDEKKFDDLFVVTVVGPKQAKVVQLKYNTVSPG
jgi:phosphohistidine phosphatase SixA